MSTPAGTVRYGSTLGRWVIAAAALGSGIAFLDTSIVNAALPAIRRDLGGSLAGQQWVATGYLLTLGSLLVVGGSFGDRFGRRSVFVAGLVGFAFTSAMCGLSPTLPMLIVSRVLKGVSAAALVPGSMAMLGSVFHPDDRARAIGAWSGLAGVSTAIGPFLGGWLIDDVSWRWVFLINPVLVIAPIVIALRFVPDSRDEHAAQIDIVGGLLLSLGLAGVVYGLIEGPDGGWSALPIAATSAGVLALVAFVAVEHTSSHPMVPLQLFASRAFSGANIATFVIWGALGAVLFLVTIRLQDDLGYSALEAGASTLPMTALIMTLAPRSGALAQRIGPKLPLTIGAAVIAAGFLTLTRVTPGRTYVTGVLPGVLLLGIGLAAAIAPVTTTVLAAAHERHAGIASAINNALARVASLLVVAVIPSVTGMVGASVGAGYQQAMGVCACLALAGAAVSFATVPGRSRSGHTSGVANSSTSSSARP